jgi:hypothetical protein
LNKNFIDRIFRILLGIKFIIMKYSKIKTKKKKKETIFKRNNMEDSKKSCCASTHKLKENMRFQMNKIAK